MQGNFCQLRKRICVRSIKSIDYFLPLALLWVNELTGLAPSGGASNTCFVF